MDVTIVIVSFNTAALLDACLASIIEQTRSCSYEIIVVDNASYDGTPGMLRDKYPAVTLIVNDTNRGFAAANNQGFALGTGRYFFMLNPDTLILDRAIDRLVAYMDAHPSAGICGPRNIGRDGALQYNCDYFPSLWNIACGYANLGGLFPKNAVFARNQMRFWDYAATRDVDRVMGCSLMIRSDLFKTLGGLDTRYFMYFEETDLCYRARKAGARVVFVHDAVIIHLGGESSNTQTKHPVFYKTIYPYFYASQYRFYWKNYGWLPMIAVRALDLAFAAAIIGRNLLRRNRSQRSLELRRGYTLAALALKT